MENNLETTDGGRDAKGRFLNGVKAGPGRPKGSRSKLSEDFLRDLAAQWEKSGVYALERLAGSDPASFVKIVASVLPKQMEATLTADPELVEAMDNARTFAEAFRKLAEIVGSELEPPMIQAEIVEAADDGE